MILLLLILALLILFLLILALLILLLLILALLILFLLILLLLILLLLLQRQLQVVFGVQIIGIAEQGLPVRLDGRFPALGVVGRVAGIEETGLRHFVSLGERRRFLQLLQRLLVLAFTVEHVGCVIKRLG